MSNVQNALKAYEERRKKEEEAKKQNKGNPVSVKTSKNVSAALSKYESRKKQEAQDTFANLSSILDKEYGSLEKASKSLGWGEESFKSAVESTRESRSTLSKLSADLYRYKGKGYYDDEDIDKAIEMVTSYKTAYNDILESAKGRSKYKSEEDYNTAIAKAEKAEADRKAMLDYDRVTGMAEIEALEKELAELRIPENDARGIASAEALIKKLLEENQSLEAYRAKGHQPSIEKYKQNEETIAFYRQKIKEVQDPYNAQVQELKSTISQKRAYHVLAGRAQDAAKLASVADPNSENYDKDFGKYSAVNNAYADDLVYKYINDIDNFRGTEQTYWTTHGTYTTDNGLVLPTMKPAYMESAYEHMTDEERGLYNYYYEQDKKNGTNTRLAYLDSIQETLNYRAGKAMYKPMEDKEMQEMLFGIAAGLDQFKTGMENLFSNEDYIPTSAMQYASGMVREDLADNSIPIWYNFKEGKWEDRILGNSVGQVAYDSITTTSNMLPSILVSFVPVVGQTAGAVTLGASAAGNAKAEMLKLGYSKGQATAYGIMVGATEVAMEKLLGGIPGLSKGDGIFSTLSSKAISKIDNALARAAITVGGSALDEALEEGLQTIIEPWLAEIATNVDWDDPTVDEILYSSLLGALSSIGLVGGKATIGLVADKVQQNQQTIDHGKAIIDNGGLDYLKQFALEVSGATQGKDSKKLANLEGKVEKNASAKNVGKLSAKTEDIVIKQNRTDIQKALVEKGLSEKKAKSVAEYLGNTKALTEAQIAEIEGNESIKAVAEELINNKDSSISERSRKLIAARLGVDIKNANINASESGELSLRNDVDVTEKVSEAGKTSLASTGEAVVIDKSKPIAKVEYVEGERVVYLNTDHGIVEASNVKYASKDEALIYESFVDMNPSFANAVITNYDGSVPMQTYINGMREGIILYGMHNFQAVGKDISKDSYLAALSERDQNFALKLGRAYAKADAKNANADLRRAIKNAAEKAEASKGASTSTSTQNKAKKGKVSFEEGAKAETHKQHRKIVALAKVLASAIGIDIVFYDSRITPKEAGRGANGYFDADNDTIYLDLQNAKDDAKTIAYTLSHELVHFIKKWSPEKFNTFAEFLMEQYASHGVSAATLLKNKMVELKTRDADKAYEELICDACETMLLDSNAVVKLMELRKSDLELFEKIKLHILKILNDIREAYKKLGYQPTSDEAKALLGMKDVLEQFYSLFEEAAVDATQTYQATIGTRSLEDFSKAETTDGKKLFQYKAIKADENAYRDMLHKWGKMSTEQIDNLFKTVDTAVNLIKDNLEVLDYAWEADIDDRAFSPVKPNSDKLYQVSLDFSTLCRKRILQQTIIAQLQEALNKPLSKEEGIAIRDALIALQEEGRQIEVACALCYVESARMKSPEQIKRFVENREAVIKEFFAGKSGGDIKTKIKKAEDAVREKLYKENPDGIKGKDGETMLDPREAKLNTLPKKYADEIRAAKRTAKQSYTPTAEEQRIIEVAKGMTVSDFTSPEGLENLAKNYPSLFDAYTSYIRNATKSKGIENDTWWRAGDSMQIGDVLIANMNRENGLRSQSWSDFQVVHILDYIAATIELATRETKEQAYTKVPDYAELMGNTGVMINLSLIPTAKFNGTLDYDSVEGIDYKRALELRDKYHRTVGTICIGVDNVQIKMLLADVTIDYVIPYHKSGMSAAVRKLMHIPSWSQYEEYQSEKKLSRAEAKKQAEKYGVKLLAESDPNYQKDTSFSEWFDIKEAQQIATIENANPSDTAKHKKYGVMYGGYMAMQNAADNYLKLCAERGISPKFSHEKANFTAEENYWKLLIDRKMIDNITGEVIEQQTIKPIFEESEIMRILNDELERYPSIKADQDYAIRKVTEGMLSGSIKGGMSAEAIAKVMKTPVDNVTKVNILASNEGSNLGIKKQVKRIVGESGTDYGIGVYLDSTLLTGFTDEERVGMVIERIKELGGSAFTAYDKNNNAVDVHIVEYGRRFKNKNGRKVRIYDHMLGFLKNEVKQEAVVLADELISTSFYDKNEPAAYPHDWLDNNGVNDWETWKTYLQDKENTVWEATLKIANSANGEKILYEIHPIKMVEQSGKPNTSTTIDGEEVEEIDTTSTDNKISQDEPIVKNNSENSQGNSKIHQQKKKSASSSQYAPTFYSQMGKVIDDIKMDKIGASSLIPFLKGKGIKHDEIKWSGIETFLEGKKSVTKAELQEFVAGSQLVIEEESSMDTGIELVQDSNTGDLLLYIDGKVEDTFFKNENGEIESRETDLLFIDERHLLDSFNEDYGRNPRWSRYKLDGGTNYRELVFKMPNSSYSNNAMRMHWGEDAEGVLAHARIQDMTTADGKNMLFIEEIQSDWHNEGAQRGYIKEDGKAYAHLEVIKEKGRYSFIPKGTAQGSQESEADLRKRMGDTRVDSLRRQLINNDNLGSVPDAPFRTNYHEYVLKRLLRMAAEEGYDSIGWTPADIQSERWSEEYAEGYRIEYDQDMPKFLKKYGKKWGATVGTTTVNGTEIWSMDITDSMEQSVLYEGQPKFQKKKLSNRTILANTLEGAVDTSTQEGRNELEWLKKYQDKISLIEKEEAHLAEVNAEIKEISFTKGSDRSKLKALNDEKVRTANRINTYDKQLLRLESMKPIKDVLAREKELVRRRTEEKGREALDAYREKMTKTQQELLTRYQESRKKGKEALAKEKERHAKTQQKGKEALAKEKERNAKTQRELLTRYQESRKKGVEGRHKTEMRYKIKNVVNDLNSYLLKGTKEKHVPINLQKVVAEALDAVNMDTVGAEERIAKKFEELRKAKTPEQMTEISKTIYRLQEQGGNIKDKLSHLKTAYDDIINSEDPLVANSHDEVISNTIAKVIEMVGETPLRDMSLYQLEAVYDMYKMILAKVRGANKAFKAQKGEEISTLANQTIVEFINQKKLAPYSKEALDAINEFNWNNLKPIYALERMGSKTLTKLYNNVRAGEDVWAKDMDEAKVFLEAQYKKHGWDSFDLNKKYDFVDPQGKKFTLRLEQIMSIYAYSKRGEDAIRHLREGGFQFDKLTEVKEKKGTYQLKDSTVYKISDELLFEITRVLNEVQGAKEFVDEMQEYLSSVMGEKGNEVSLAMYEVKLFKEKNYFPLKVSHEFLERAREQAQGTVKIKNSGFTNSLKEGATKTVVLSPFMDVWAQHVNDMSMYHAFTLPLEDFYRVYNYSTPAVNNMETLSVISTLSDAHREGAVKYIDQLLKDLNGGARSDPRENPFKKLLTNFKKAKVMLSLSVVIQQPSAIVRAQALVDTKYFGGKRISKDKANEMWEKMKKYAPVVIIKDMGGFDTGMGKGSADWLKDNKTWKDKADDVISYLPAKADQLTWIAIWRAVERETLHTHKNLRPNSEEFLQAVGERFTEVVTKTQVYDSTLSRSANMRSKNLFMQMATAFLAEPTTSINMLGNAIRTKDKKQIARVFASVYGSVLLNSALVSLVYAMRDDDEDETLLEKYLSRLATEVIDGVNPLTYIPWVKDVWAVAQGYDIERADMSLVSDFMDVVKSWTQVLAKDTSEMDDEELAEHRKAVLSASLKIPDAVASLLGIPVANARRDLNGIINAIKTIGKDITERDTSMRSLGNEVVEDVKDTIPVWGWLPDKKKEDKLYKAIIKGDEAYAERLENGYDSDKAYTNAIRKALKRNDPRIEEAAKADMNGDVEEYTDIINEIIAEGNFSKADVLSAINSKINDLTEDEPAESTSSKEVSIYEIDDYFTSIKKGNISMAEDVKEDIIATKVANGATQEDAEESFVSSFRTYVGKSYKNGEISRSDATNKLTKYGEYDSNEAYWKLREWDYDIKYGEDAEYSKYTTFYEAVKTGSNLIAVIKEYTEHGVKTETLATQITSYYKPMYQEMSNSERARLKGYLLNAYERLGYNRAKKSKDIDKWLED
jgi:hypothetical protein